MPAKQFKEWNRQLYIHNEKITSLVKTIFEGFKSNSSTSSSLRKVRFEFNFDTPLKEEYIVVFTKSDVQLRSVIQ